MNAWVPERRFVVPDARAPRSKELLQWRSWNNEPLTQCPQVYALDEALRRVREDRDWYQGTTLRPGDTVIFRVRNILTRQVIMLGS